MAGILLEGQKVSAEERARYAREFAAQQRAQAQQRQQQEWRGIGDQLLRKAAQVEGTVLRDSIVQAGAHAAFRMKANERLRIIDLEGRQAVDFLCYDGADTENRYNAANTMKVNRSVYIGRGFRLFSDHGDVLMTIVEDTVGGHDTIGGCCSEPMNRLRYGVPDTPNCRANFIAALKAHGLGPRDIPANLNFFMHVPVSANGETEILEGKSRPGDFVELRADRDVLVAISNCPQIFNPCNGWNPTPIRLLTWQPVP